MSQDQPNEPGGPQSDAEQGQQPTGQQTGQSQNGAPPGPQDVSTPKIIYVLHLLGVVTGGLTSLVGVIMAYINKSEAPEWLQSHYRFQIRTFWMGLLYGLIAAVTVAIFIGIILMLVLFVWWIARNAYGLKFLSKQQPVPNPKSWLLGRK